MCRIAATFAAGLLAASAPASPICEANGVSVSADFHQGGLAACTITADGRIDAMVVPEVQPINPSPWYAFRLIAPAGRDVTVTLRYQQGKHRYQPWVQANGVWQRLPAERVTISGDGRATFRLPSAQNAPMLVAAQPLDNLGAALAPFEAKVAAGTLRRIDGVMSLEARPVPMFLHWPDRPRGFALFTARQHPPEVPGAITFDAFAAAIMAETPLMEKLRSHVAILWVPVMNPDGIARGHWRGNRIGADLNRDWGGFRQPETRGIGAMAEALAGQMPMLAAMDFHATWRDVLYAPPTDTERLDAGQRFMALMAATTETADVAVSRSHTTDAGTLKGWTMDRFGVSGLTWEVGDSTDADVNRSRAKAAATMMATAILEALEGETGR